MSNDDSGEKTEEPTPHKFKEAKEQGQTAKSKDLTTASLLFASFYVLKATGGYIWNHITDITTYSFDHIPLEITASVAGNLGKQALYVFLLALAPMFLVTMLVAMLVEVAQSGLSVSLEPLKPDFNKLNPIEGFKNLFSLKQVVELVKSFIKMIVICYVIYNGIKANFYGVLIAQQVTLWQIVEYTGKLVMDTVNSVALFYFIIAIFDYFYQRYEFVKSLKMSKKEIKDEYKQLEGDPVVKQRQRDAQFEMSQSRQMESVPGADVVVTNPVHVAIAIKYEQNKMKAPRVLAKGKRLIAYKIRNIAEEANIPIVEDPPLARNLYDTALVGKEIPSAYYKAVALILAFVYRLKKKNKRRF